VLQAVPALRALGRAGTVAFAGQPRLGRLLQGLGVVQSARSFDGLGLEALFTDGPPSGALADAIRGFDRVISWFGARDQHYTRRIRALSPEAVVAAPVPADGSALPVWRHLLATIGDVDTPETAPLRPPPAWCVEAQRVLEEIGRDVARPLLVIHPGAGGTWKLWPVDRFARVIEGVTHRHEVQVLMHQGPADSEATDQLARALALPALRLVAPDLPVLAAVLARAAAYLGGDAGVSHLAAAIGSPAVLVMPSGTRERWAPWSPTVTMFSMSDDSSETDRVMASVNEQLIGARAAGARPTSDVPPAP
jgi:hypothetical protein